MYSLIVVNITIKCSTQLHLVKLLLFLNSSVHDYLYCRHITNYLICAG